MKKKKKSQPPDWQFFSPPGRQETIFYLGSQIYIFLFTFTFCTENSSLKVHMWRMLA